MGVVVGASQVHTLEMEFIEGRFPGLLTYVELLLTERQMLCYTVFSPKDGEEELIDIGLKRLPAVWENFRRPTKGRGPKSKLKHFSDLAKAADEANAEEIAVRKERKRATFLGGRARSRSSEVSGS